MTVADLIAELQKYPPQVPVVVVALGATMTDIVVERAQTPIGFAVAIVPE